jgi:hypothetical protein
LIARNDTGGVSVRFLAQNLEQPGENGSIMGPDARQQVVREVNERIRELSLNGAEVLKAGRTRFLCECGDPACLETMELSFVEYERVRNEHW